MASKIAAGEDLRIVLIGKTGVGKSAVGNTILGEKLFKSISSLTSCTKLCEKMEKKFNGRLISVVDTAGILDTHAHESLDDMTQEIVKCIQFSCPGPHVFLLVMAVGRFTPEEKNAVQALQKLFGEAADKYMMVLFTKGDDLESQTIHQYVRNPEARARDFREKVLNRCGGRYHVFNNRSKDRDQVVELIKMIDQLDAANGGTYYTNEMFQEAESVIALQPEPRAEAERRRYTYFAFLPRLVECINEFLRILRDSEAIVLAVQNVLNWR